MAAALFILCVYFKIWTNVLFDYLTLGSQFHIIGVDIVALRRLSIGNAGIDLLKF